MQSWSPIIIPKAFSPDECEQMLSLGRDLKWQRPRQIGLTMGNRLGVTAYVSIGGVSWLDERISMLFENANRTFGFDISSVEDSVQLAKYKEEDFVDWHHDCNLSSTKEVRKLAISVLLSDCKNFEGGALQFREHMERTAAQKQGTAVLFPSFAYHRVSQVLKGVRVSLVTWAIGPHFK